MSDAAYYRAQAERCRRLIRGLDDPAAEQRLAALAEDYERRAQGAAAERHPPANSPRPAEV